MLDELDAERKKLEGEKEQQEHFMQRQKRELRWEKGGAFKTGWNDGIADSRDEWAQWNAQFDQNNKR